ncbi:DUF2927 domain-containing protein [Tabrizicola sp.]|uniref:DUF2927 domain-containing protein n=1 Tax=Tabrizicola sp. TaxID=2005166 RepID=UPI001A624122|nr:DUF2927 domain-containing protein [Tabrizicola sp.]MBL9075049.1 DUF2927 domain-containing protein [Tabrizicola sp.]
MAAAGTVRSLVALAACLVLAACLGTGTVLPPSAPVPVVPTEPTAKSAAAAIYYAQVQQVLLAQGMLRTDGGEGIPVSTRTLTDNFMRIALYDEYRRGSGGFVREETESRLRRWEVPVRVGIRFGPSVPPDRQATDRARIGSFVARLAQITGHPMAVDDRNPNFFVYVVSEDEREALGPVVHAALPGLSPSDVAGITQMPRSTYCLVYAMAEGNSGAYTRAFAVIRSEHPDLLRLSCLHEEMTQGLGLPNDSPRARPSIFNDDEEFALLTDQDEMLLRILYSRELRPGMTAAEAQPIVESLARRMTGGDS